MAADLRLLGVKSVADLGRRDPERLYARLCDLTREKQDPCVLYVFRGAVYASRTALPEPMLLVMVVMDRPAVRRAGPRGEDDEGRAGEVRAQWAPLAGAANEEVTWRQPLRSRQ